MSLICFYLLGAVQIHYYTFYGLFRPTPLTLTQSYNPSPSPLNYTSIFILAVNFLFAFVSQQKQHDKIKTRKKAERLDLVVWFFVAILVVVFFF